MENISVKNKLDSLFYHTAICLWVEQIAIDGRGKLSAQIILRLFAIKVAQK
jgi:hypothetical protein